MADAADIKRRLARLLVRVGEAGLDAVGVRPPRALLLLGHMRSGSTLLLHLLLTNPDFAGMGERNAPYASEADLGRLALATRLARRRPFARVDYVVDQINHNQFTPDTALFESPRVRVVFLLRQPEPSLASLLDLTRTYYVAWSVERAVDYYVERLAALATYGHALSSSTGRAAFLTYEDLIDRPTEVLAHLAAFLETRIAFSERYDVHDFTGTRGDPGANIRSGRIGRPRTLPPVTFPPDALARATRAYDQCRAALARFALSDSGRG